MATPIYAAILALVFVFLSVRTLVLRRKLKIGIGTGENETMLRATRAHANFAEYTPLALLLAFMIESMKANPLVIHFVCICLVVGRVIHSYGVSQQQENFIFRVSGMAFTFTSICSSAIAIIIISFTGIG